MTGPDGLLKSITKQVLESALEEEMTEHVGYDKHAVEGRNGGNSRNGTRAKTVLTDNAGPVEVEVPRDRDGSFSPVIVAKRQRRLSDVDAVVLSLYARGLTTGEISEHFAEVYGASVSKDTVSRITDRVVEDMQAWSARPLQPVYAAVFIDAIRVKVRDGQVGNQTFYAAIGVDLAGRRDVLGLWPGSTSGGESSKFWLAALTDLRNRGVRDVFFVVCDGLTGLPDSVGAVFPAAIVQTCVIHLIRGSFRYASRHYWEQLGALACGHFEVAHREGAAGLHDVADGLDRVSGGGCEEVDLVFDREYLVGVEEQCERRVAAGAVGDGAGSTLSSWPRP